MLHQAVTTNRHSRKLCNNNTLNQAYWQKASNQSDLKTFHEKDFPMK